LAVYSVRRPRQLDRQIASLAYQRTRGTRSRSSKDEALPADAQVRDPFVREFVNLKDEYSEEMELENALIQSLERDRSLFEAYGGCDRRHRS
jgi:predicted nuclease of restriction endonuclease-like (RecB) superfamily